MYDYRAYVLDDGSRIGRILSEMSKLASIQLVDEMPVIDRLMRYTVLFQPLADDPRAKENETNCYKIEMMLRAVLPMVNFYEIAASYGDDGSTWLTEDKRG